MDADAVLACSSVGCVSSVREAVQGEPKKCLQHADQLCVSMLQLTRTNCDCLLHTHTVPGALAEDPKLLLLDELTTFLDVEDQFGVLQAVKSITQQRRDVTAVWVTHRCGLQPWRGGQTPCAGWKAAMTTSLHDAAPAFSGQLSTEFVVTGGGNNLQGVTERDGVAACCDCVCLQV